MGTACARPAERVFASPGGQDGAETRFESCRDVSGAGVLCALAALLSNGLLDGACEFLGKIKGVPKHVEMGELDEGDQFQGLRSGRKRLLDTVKMIAWRSETAMAPILTSPTVDGADARSILQDLFVSDADIIPEYEDGILRVRVHIIPFSSPAFPMPPLPMASHSARGYNLSFLSGIQVSQAPGGFWLNPAGDRLSGNTAIVLFRRLDRVVLFGMVLTPNASYVKLNLVFPLEGLNWIGVP